MSPHYYNFHNKIALILLFFFLLQRQIKTTQQRKFDKRPQQRSPRKSNAKPSNRFVQASSVFSEGTAEIKRPNINSDRYLSYRNNDVTAAAMEIPKVIKKNWTVNKKEEDEVRNELLADDENSSSDEDCTYQPIVLPLRENKVGFLKNFQMKKECDVEVKREECDGEVPRNEDSSSGSIKFEVIIIFTSYFEAFTAALFELLILI